MAYIIAEPCIGTKDTACVEVCPVDYIHPTKDEPAFEAAQQLYIDPETCIDCGACEPVCPVQAIYPLEELPADKASWAQLNADKISGGGLENITEMQDALPGAEERKKALGF